MNPKRRNSFEDSRKKIYANLRNYFFLSGSFALVLCQNDLPFYAICFATYLACTVERPVNRGHDIFWG